MNFPAATCRSFGLIVILFYSLGIVLWQHNHLSSQYAVIDSLLLTTKDAYFSGQSISTLMRIPNTVSSIHRPASLIQQISFQPSVCEERWSRVAKTNFQVPNVTEYLRFGWGGGINVSMVYSYVYDGCGTLPHGMQQLYAAFSWARRSEDPTIIFDYAKYKKPQVFYKGFVETMPLFNITVVRNKTRPGQLTVTRNHGCQNLGYHLQDDDAQTLSRTIFADRCPHILREQIERQALLLPRVGILNRKSSRILINAQQILNHLNATSIHGHYTVSESPIYFEKADFQEQIEFFASHDIILTPHGAQITGVAFMSMCGQLMEIFPHGYLDPKFFGTLTRASGVQHYYSYLSPDQNETYLPERVWLRSKYARDKARRADLCADRTMMLDAVLQMVGEWKECLKVRMS